MAPNITVYIEADSLDL